MKTSIKINESLVAKVKQILGTETIRETVERSLEEVVRYQALEASAKLLGKIDLDLTEESIRRQRRERLVSR